MAAKGRPSKADSTWAIFPFVTWCHSATKVVAAGRGFGLQLEEDGDVVPFRNDLFHVQPHHDL